ncbi:MAG TPA: SCO family protein [Candidatus Limnocylindrales bacterium]|nr:SCO family protein [Candidatus Limnocylindrales bacterium]
MKQLVVAVFAGLLAACMQPAHLDDMGPAPAFRLTDQGGHPFDSHALAGHIWVADFVYTTCPGPCPMMSSQMHRLQDATAAEELTDVRFVSFTVDPAHDTPPVLAAYSKHFKADPARWTFLTGPQPEMNAVGMGFKLNPIDGSLDHSTRFALVDRRGRIRGFYLTSEDGFMGRLLHNIRQLEREK